MRSRPFKRILSVLLGAGAFCLGSIAASAGDKIAFSLSGQKSLAMPAVIQPDDHSDDLTFRHSSMAPVEDLEFMPQQTTITILPRNKNKNRNSLDGKSDSSLSDQRMNDPWASTDDQANDNSDPSSTTATNRLKIGMPRDWNSPLKSDDVRMGSYSDDSARTGRDNRDNRDLSDSLLRHDRDRQSDTMLGKSIDKQRSLSAAMEDTRGLGSRPSLMEAMRDQNSYSTEVELYRHSQSSDLPQSYTSMDQGSSSIMTPRAEDRPSLFSQSRGYVESSSRQSVGSQAPIAPSHAWDSPTSTDSGAQYNATPAYTPPPSQYLPPNHSAVLQMPKYPGSPF